MPKSSVFGVFLLIIGYWILIIPPKVGAACWCADPIVDNCQCGRTGTSNFPASITYDAPTPLGTTFKKTINLFCDSAEETRSEFTVKAPVCGSSPEILPWCAYGIDGNKNFWVCYGAGFIKGNSSLPTPPVDGQTKPEITGPFTFNGQAFGSAGTNNVTICWKGLFCCGSKNSCNQSGIPALPTSCVPQRTGVTTPVGLCTSPSGAGESRIFIPHLRNISALATLLQTMFNPFPSLFKNNVLPVPDGKTASSSVTAQDTVTSKIYFHQGLDDNTQYVDSGNNSSLKVNQDAPAPLYSFTGGSIYKESGLCNITDTKFNPGDDLLGPTITAGLLYTQKYTYPALPKPAGCVEDNQTTSNPIYCCSKGGTIVDGTDPTHIIYRCNTSPGYSENTKGRIAVFTKTPLVEYIYDTLVVGTQSVFKRLMPQGNPKEFKEIAGQAQYSVSSDANKLAVAGQSGGTPTIFFPHVGSLKEYFLDGIQKALRPLSNLISSGFANSTAGDCNAVAAQITAVSDCKSGSGLVALQACLANSEIKAITEAAGSAYSVPPDLLLAIASIETVNTVFDIPKDQVSTALFHCEANECGAMGAMQLLTGFGVQSSCSQAQSDPKTANWAKYACKSNGKVPNPGNIRDSMFSAANMISSLGIGSGGAWTQAQVLELGYRYFGSATQTFDLGAILDRANACLNSSQRPNVGPQMTYGDYLWNYYNSRR